MHAFVSVPDVQTWVGIDVAGEASHPLGFVQKSLSLRLFFFHSVHFRFVLGLLWVGRWRFLSACRWEGGRSVGKRMVWWSGYVEEEEQEQVGEVR